MQSDNCLLQARRCFEISGIENGVPVKVRICVWWGAWSVLTSLLDPILQRSLPRPDSGPVDIEGISPALMREIQTLDVIAAVSRNLSSGGSQAVREAALEGLKRIQGQLPRHISLIVEAR